MDRDFLTEHPRVRTPGERRETPNPRAGLAARPLQHALFRSKSPLHPRLVGAGAMLLVATLVTDIMYTRSLLFQWDNFSIWLLLGGLVLAALAGLALIFDLASHRIKRIDWLRFSGFTAAALLSILNALVHSRDAYTAVAPQGLELSLLVSAILLTLGWRGWSVGLRHSYRPTVSEGTRS